jgi:sarcosine oxidase gamma subunit
MANKKRRKKVKKKHIRAARKSIKKSVNKILTDEFVEKIMAGAPDSGARSVLRVGPNTFTIVSATERLTSLSASLQPKYPEKSLEVAKSRGPRHVQRGCAARRGDLRNYAARPASVLKLPSH